MRIYQIIILLLSINTTTLQLELIKNVIKKAFWMDDDLLMTDYTLRELECFA